MRHIKITSGDGDTWCGILVADPTIRHFNDAEAAALYRKYQGTDPICPECIEVIIEHLHPTRCPENAENETKR